MFVIGEAIIDDVVAGASFCCDLKSCKGACCCINGGRGAPLEDHEVLEIQNALPFVKPYLSPKSVNAIERHGMFEGQPGDFATTCVEGHECVFAYFEGGIAGCSFERAFLEGNTTWRKPLSCHLFPLRIRRKGKDHIRYEQIDECGPGRARGVHDQVQLFEFLKEPLVRKYGEQWYAQLREYCSPEQVRRDVV